MGQGGIDPGYFLDEMTWTEILLYLKGLKRRGDTTYDAMRIQTANILSGIGAKKENGDSVSMFDIYSLPGEAEALEEIKKKESAKMQQMLHDLNHPHATE